MNPELGKTYDYSSTEAENRLRFEHNAHTPGESILFMGPVLIMPNIPIYQKCPISE